MNTLIYSYTFMYTQIILYNIMLYFYVFTEIVSSQFYIDRFRMYDNKY